MIALEVTPNPNCEGIDYQVFQEMGPPRKVRMMKLEREGKERLFWVTGIEEEGKICPAYAQEVADSGGGVTFLVFGGRWGLRFKPEELAQEPWDLANPSQWGEPFKFYGVEQDIVFEED